jgi:hypothetical protein
LSHAPFVTSFGFIVSLSLFVIVIMLRKSLNNGRSAAPQYKSIVHLSPAFIPAGSACQLQLTEYVLFG